MLKDIGESTIIEVPKEAKEEQKLDKPKKVAKKEPAGQLSLVSAINTN